jgi:hypothetical protein
MTPSRATFARAAVAFAGLLIVARPAFAAALAPGPRLSPHDVLASEQVTARTMRPLRQFIGQRVDVPPLRRLVSHVVGLRPEKEMGRVAACGIVAAVANAHASRNRTIGSGVRGTVRVVPVRSSNDQPVPVWPSRSGPQPARIRSARTVDVSQPVEHSRRDHAEEFSR